MLFGFCKGGFPLGVDRTLTAGLPMQAVLDVS